MLFILNVFIALIGFVYYSKRTIDYGMLLSPHMIIWGMPLLLLFYPAWLNRPFYINDSSFNLIMTLGLIGSLIGCLIVKIPRFGVGLVGACREEDRAHIPDVFLKAGAALYLIFLLYHIVEPVVISKSITAALSVSRLDQYLSGGILKGSGIELLFLFPEILFYIYIGACFNKRRYYRALALCLVLSLYYVFNANTRLPMIMPLASVIIIFIPRLSRRLLLWLAPFILMSAIVFVFAFSVLGNAIRWGRLSSGDDLVEGIKLSFEAQNRLELGYYDWLYHLYDAIELGQVPPDNGAAWCYYGPISIFPRALWPDKPLTSTSNRLTEGVYNSRIGSGIPITTFTIYGEGFWQAGYLGAFLAPVLFMVIYGMLIKNIQFFQNTEFWLAMLMCQMATFFRGELPVPQFITTMFFIVFLWLIWQKWEWLENMATHFYKMILIR